MLIDTATARKRYEAIFRAIGLETRTALWLCVAATAALAAVYVLLLAGRLARALLEAGIPPWTAAGLQAAIVLSVLVTAPSLAQMLVIRGDTAAAIEAINAWGMAETERWRREGIRVPVLRKADRVLPWLAKHPEVRGSLRVRLLAWSGAVDQAREVLASMPHDAAFDAFDAFEVALLSSMLDFVVGGPGDLRAASERLALVPAADYERARIALAFEQARAAHGGGRPWQAPLVAARHEIAIPAAASIRGRLLSGWRVGAAIVAGGTLLSILATILR